MARCRNQASWRIQKLYLDGHKRDAIAAVPDRLIDEVALCGSRERVAERLATWKDAGVTTLICMIHDQTTLRAMPELMDRR